MIVNGDRTVFREDLGIWLRREPPYKEPKKLPKCMGWNRSRDRWTGWAKLVRQDVDDRILRLRIFLHSGHYVNATTSTRSNDIGELSE
jgi:hypothetical protein